MLTTISIIGTMPSENAERNRERFMVDPCESCLSKATIGARASVASLNPLVMADAERAAFNVALLNCEHTFDVADVLGAHVPLEDIFALGHIYGEHCAKNIELLSAAIDDGHIALSRHMMPRVTPLSAAELELFSGRSDRHKLICKMCACWLQSKNIGWSARLDHLRHRGGIADVISKDRTISFEAGYTSAAKILAATDTGMSVMVVPYIEETGLPIHVGFLFERVGERTKPDPYECNATKGLL
jgi:hypothetical protein